jgi:hypothetical protein
VALEALRAPLVLDGIPERFVLTVVLSFNST